MSRPVTGSCSNHTAKNELPDEAISDSSDSVAPGAKVVSRRTSPRRSPAAAADDRQSSARGRKTGEDCGWSMDVRLDATRDLWGDPGRLPSAARAERAPGGAARYDQTRLFGRPAAGPSAAHGGAARRRGGAGQVPA